MGSICIVNELDRFGRNLSFHRSHDLEFGCIYLYISRVASQEIWIRDRYIHFLRRCKGTDTDHITFSIISAKGK